MSDEYVLKSQKYLNSMYGGHPSWVTLQENGNTGTLVKSLGKTLKKPYFMGFFYFTLLALASLSEGFERKQQNHLLCGWCQKMLYKIITILSIMKVFKLSK